MTRSFDDLVNEAVAADVEGCDFSWLNGGATEERPSWGYAKMMAKRMAAVTAALDIQTGGGEILATVPKFPALTVATESWPPNVTRDPAAASAGPVLLPAGWSRCVPNSLTSARWFTFYAK